MAHPDPAIAELGKAAQSAYAKVQAGATVGQAVAGTAIQVAPEAVTILETGLKTAVDGFVTMATGAAGPIGLALAPEAVTLANDALAWGEQAALTFVQNMFHHAKAVVTTPGHPATMAPVPNP